MMMILILMMIYPHFIRRGGNYWWFCQSLSAVFHLSKNMSIDDKTGKNDDDYDINDFFWLCCQSLRRDVLYLRRDLCDDEDDDHEHDHDDKDDVDGGECPMSDTLCFILVFNIHKVKDPFSNVNQCI